MLRVAEYGQKMFRDRTKAMLDWRGPGPGPGVGPGPGRVLILCRLMEGVAWWLLISPQLVLPGAVFIIALGCFV